MFKNPSNLKETYFAGAKPLREEVAYTPALFINNYKQNGKEERRT
jgi:hypothetical protein